MEKNFFSEKCNNQFTQASASSFSTLLCMYLLFFFFETWCVYTFCNLHKVSSYLPNDIYCCCCCSQWTLSLLSTWEYWCDQRLCTQYTEILPLLLFSLWYHLWTISIWLMVPSPTQLRYTTAIILESFSFFHIPQSHLTSHLNYLMYPFHLFHFSDYHFNIGPYLSKTGNK